ncbi:hypothetical protein A2U01_0110065, partial [Trifolium medium]|nr:hypothetical protein [Trifolium medium]
MFQISVFRVLWYKFSEARRNDDEFL